MKALRTIFAIAALTLVGSALALVQPQGYAGKSLLRAANSVSFRGSSEGSSAWTPASIAGLKVWLDPTVASSVTVATGASQINDLSGNGNHATQATASNQPAYTAGSHITLDGVDDWMEIPALGAINSNPRSYVVQARFSVAQQAGLLSLRQAGTFKQFSLIVFNASVSGNGKRRIGFTNGTLASNQTVVEGSDSDANWHTAVLTRVNTSMKLYLDGVLVATNSTNVGEVDVNHKTLLGVSADSDMPVAGYYFNGDVKRVLIYNTELSLTDVQTLYANGY